MKNSQALLCLALFSAVLGFSNAQAQLRVEQSGQDDALNVATAVQSAITDHSGLSDAAHQIRVTTTDSHELYLTGHVASLDEKQEVESIAQPYIGDFHMKDELIVNSQPIQTTENNVMSVRLANR